jgi:hypothetical protein
MMKKKMQELIEEKAFEQFFHDATLNLMRI